MFFQELSAITPFFSERPKHPALPGGVFFSATGRKISRNFLYLNAPAAFDTIEFTSGATTVSGKAAIRLCQRRQDDYNIEMYEDTFTADGLKLWFCCLCAPATGRIFAEKPSLILNASGNILTSCYTGIYATSQGRRKHNDKPHRQPEFAGSRSRTIFKQWHFPVRNSAVHHYRAGQIVRQQTSGQPGQFCSVPGR